MHCSPARDRRRSPSTRTTDHYSPRRISVHSVESILLMNWFLGFICLLTVDCQAPLSLESAGDVRGRGAFERTAPGSVRVAFRKQDDGHQHGQFESNCSSREKLHARRATWDSPTLMVNIQLSAVPAISTFARCPPCYPSPFTAASLRSFNPTSARVRRCAQFIVCSHNICGRPNDQQFPFPG